MVLASPQALADALQAALPISAKQQWSDGTHGARTFFMAPFDWDSQSKARAPDWHGLQANARVLGAIAPHVRDRMMTPTIAARAALTWVERCGLEVDEKSIHQQASQMSAMVSCLRYWSRMGPSSPDVFPLLIEMKPVLPSRRVEQEVPKKEIKVEVRVVVAPEHADAAPGRRVSVAQTSTRAPRTGGPHQEKRPSSPPDASTLGAGRPEASTKKRRQTLSLD